MTDTNVKIRIWEPPDYLFLNRKVRVILKTADGSTVGTKGLDDSKLSPFIEKGVEGVQKYALSVAVPEEGFEGCVLATYQGYSKPEKGVISLETSTAINTAKRIHLVLLQIVVASPIRYLVPLFFLFPRNTQDRFALSCMRNLGYVMRWVLQRQYLNPLYWTPAAKAVYKAVIEEQDQNVRDWLMFFVCLLEYDNKYRYPVQDILGELDRDTLEKNPKREILRLVLLGANRQHGGAEKKWFDVHQALRVIFTLRPKWAEVTGQFIQKVGNMDMDEDERYTVSFISDYDYGGKTLEEREKERNA